MEKHIVYDPQLTKADRILLRTLAADVEAHRKVGQGATDDREHREGKQIREHVPARELLISDQQRRPLADSVS